MSRRWSSEDVAAYTARSVSWNGEVGSHVTHITARVTKPSKYRNRKTFVDGIKFDSALESRCYESLRLRQKAGDIAFFLRQVPFHLEGGVVYRADFVAILPCAVEVIDATGHMTPAKSNKLKQVNARYGVDVVLWSDTK